MAYEIVDNIYERMEDGQQQLVLTHVFYGGTLEDAEHIDCSHRETDKFHNAAINGRPFKGIELTVRREVWRVAGKGEPRFAVLIKKFVIRNYR